MIAIKLDSMVFYDVGRNLEIEMNRLIETNNISTGASKVIPMIVNYAFSYELALKYILSKNSISYNNLHKLLSLIPSNIRKYLIYNIAEMANKTREEILNELDILSNSFVEWRYFYEGNLKNTNIMVLSKFSYLLNHF